MLDNIIGSLLLLLCALKESGLDEHELANELVLAAENTDCQEQLNWFVRLLSE